MYIYTQLQDAYLRLLMTSTTKDEGINCINIGESRARYLMTKYSCPRLLHDHLTRVQDPDCLSTELSDKKNQKCKKLSQIIYTNWTSSDY